MIDITLRRVADLAALETPWRALEARSAGSFFQGWTWTGCLAAERFRDPVLLQAHEQGRLVALALFNRGAAWLAPGRLHLGESGDRARDAVFVEHNGPLIEAGRECLLAPCLAAAFAAPVPGLSRRRRALVLSGVSDAVLAAASELPGTCRVRRSRAAPTVDFAMLASGDYLESLSASTRYQLRRSYRCYARIGAPTVRRAADANEAMAFFTALVALHQAAWRRRGRKGAFADPAILRFHHALIARGLPRGEVDLLRVAAGGRTIGYLYNFLANTGAARRWVGNYQGGFDYPAADRHQKPGLTCHHLAIEFYRRENRSEYDFLAGDDRYKTSMAHGRTRLHWLEVTPKWSVPGLTAAGKAALHKFVSGTRPVIAR